MGVEYIAPTWPIRQRGYLTATLKANTDIYQEKNIWATPGPWPSRNTRDAPTNASRIGTWYCRVATQIPPKTPVPVNPCLMTFGVWFVPTHTRFPATQYTIWTQLQLEANFTDGRVADCDHPRHLRRLVVGWRRKTHQDARRRRNLRRGAGSVVGERGRLRLVPRFRLRLSPPLNSMEPLLVMPASFLQGNRR